MDNITLKHNLLHNITILPNEFIDHHMIKADGEYVKIYLLIQRLAGENRPIQAEELADTLELTRKDVLRALNYWKKEGLLDFGEEETPGASFAAADAPAESAATCMTSPAIPEKTSHNAADMEKSIKGTDLEQTVFMAETYIGRPLSVSDLNSLFYISDSLHFSSDLLEYLIEYCVTKGKKSVRYMESVAINWFQQGIDSVPKARDAASLYSKNVFPVMKAFGIAGRNPGPSEIDYIMKWNSLGFDTDIIIEACNRTLLATHQASFPYANRILEEWKKLGVRNAADIRSLDQKHHQAASAAGQAKSQGGAAPSQPKSTNAFHNFDQRSYDYDNLESRLLDKNRR